MEFRFHYFPHGGLKVTIPKVALITGGSSGLGLAMAQKLAAKGYVVALIARNGTRLNQAVTEIQKKGYKAFAFPGDITRETDLQNIAKETSQYRQKAARRRILQIARLSGGQSGSA